MPTINAGALGQAEDYAYGQGATRMHSEVSLTARPFFEGHGYQVEQEQQVERGGVRLTNFVMSRFIGRQMPVSGK